MTRMVVDGKKYKILRMKIPHDKNDKDGDR